MSPLWAGRDIQCWARYGSPDGPLVRMDDGDADCPVLADPQRRTFRELVKRQLLWCPIPTRDGAPCGPFAHLAQGPLKRSHFAHVEQPDEWHRGGGRESLWHQEAKRVVHSWLSGLDGLIEASVEEREFRLSDGRRRVPDVYTEIAGGVGIAFEFQRSSMAGTSRYNTPLHVDGRPEWLRRTQDYRDMHAEWSESGTFRVVWFVPESMCVGQWEWDRDGVWRVKVAGTDAAHLITAGAQVYWLDPLTGAVGTLLQHHAKNADTPGFITAPTHFPKGRSRGGWPLWMHTDRLADCRIDLSSGRFFTPSDDIVDAHRAIAQQRKRLADERRAAQAQPARVNPVVQQRLEPSPRPPTSTVVRPPAAVPEEPAPKVIGWVIVATATVMVILLAMWLLHLVAS